MTNGVDEGMTLGLPNVVIVACFCRVVWIFREILDDVTRKIYTLSGTNGEHMFLVNQDELLLAKRTVQPAKYHLPDPQASNSNVSWIKSFFCEKGAVTDLFNERTPSRQLAHRREVVVVKDRRKKSFGSGI
jgi:hypothetical protein